MGPDAVGERSTLPPLPEGLKGDRQVPPVEPGVQWEVSPDASLATLTWTCPVPPASGAAAAVLTPLLAERAYQRLREHTAWSYAPDAYTMGNRILLEAEVAPQAARRALERLQLDVEELAAGGLAAGELLVARRRASVAASTALALLSDWPSLALAPSGPRTPDDLRALPLRVVDVSAQDVSALATHCRDTSAWHVIRPEEVSEEGP